MQTFQPIEYRHTRDFSRKMNVTFEFIKQNWRALGKSILFIAGPPVLVASLIMGSFFGEIFNLAALGDDPNASMALVTSATFWLQMILAMILFLLSSVMAIATINNYIILYGELQTNQIDTSLVWERVRNTFWMYFRTTLFFFLLLMGLYIVLLIPVGLLAAISPALIFLGIMFLFFALIYLMISFSLTFIVRAYEGTGFFESLGRSFTLVKGKWWSTFGLVTVLYLIMMTISYIPIIPVYAIMIVSAIHNTSTDAMANPMAGWSYFMLIFFTLYYMVQIILASLPNVGLAFQYFNLVEMKEATGLMSNIESFGDPHKPSSPADETY